MIDIRIDRLDEDGTAHLVVNVRNNRIYLTESEWSKLDDKLGTLLEPIRAAQLKAEEAKHRKTVSVDGVEIAVVYDDNGHVRYAWPTPHNRQAAPFVVTYAYGYGLRPYVILSGREGSYVRGKRSRLQFGTLESAIKKALALGLHEVRS